MSPDHFQSTDSLRADIGDAAWVDVMQAVDRTYAELVDYQEQLETRNAELEALRTFLSSIMHSISDYLVVTDTALCIADASRSFCKAVGLPVEKLVGQPIAGFLQGTSGGNLITAISRSVAQRADNTVEAELTTTIGPEPVEFRIAPRLRGGRKRAGVILTGRPLGELRRAYSELEASHEELKQTQTQLVRNEKLASLGRLLAGVAHELNNPISFVYANTHALEKYINRFETYFDRVQAGAPREELVELRGTLKLDRDLRNLRTAIEGARDGAERVKNIVEDLRRLSAEGSGELAPTDLVRTASIAADWVERGSKSRVTIAFEGEPSCIASARAGHVQQVLMNLVQNAVDAMAEQDDAALTIRSFYDGAHAVIEVSDNGPGIPDTAAAKIFDPFFTTKEVGKGTGLGLSISHKIAEEHGGSLELVPSDQGACFRLTLLRGDQT
ncbi:PAS domain-containing protein [Donghicola sp. C2-DW-16]|uniref:histidine kinase n=1 Tax=Donghicola mangrovi TaxID=2729614 RepID=A0ABX2PIQ2_9RHOB|nr:ATP-binding protein [Donghicola mangrovi]NVO29397.1 PAS domain-containing protein [Donghicola mangrovi]